MIVRGNADVWLWRSNKLKRPGAGNPRYKYAVGAFAGPDMATIWNKTKKIRNAVKSKGRETLGREIKTRINRLFRG